MQPTPRIIALLINRAREWGWSRERLARELGVDRTTLAQYASGRRKLTMRTFGAILRKFGDDRLVWHLAFHYAAEEYEPQDALPSVDVRPLAASDDAANAIARYVERFGQESIRGRGLFLVSSNAPLASDALRVIEQALDRVGARVCRLRADHTATVAQVHAALAATVLIVERVDFACDTIAEVIERRANLVRPIVATSVEPPGTLARPHLRRVFLSMCRAIDLQPAPSPLPPHGPVPRESK